MSDQHQVISIIATAMAMLARSSRTVGWTPRKPNKLRNASLRRCRAPDFGSCQLAMIEPP
jgi:hypothetical protein